MSLKLSIVIPVYNSEPILPRLIDEIRAALDGTPLKQQYEVILVNDFSRDNSWQAIQGLAERFGFIRGLSLRKNFGQHNATMAGLNRAEGEVVVIMDDDLQHPPEAIPRLAQKIEQGADICYTRYQGRRHPGWKKLGSWFNDRVATLLLNKPGDLYLSSFKALKQEMVREIIKYKGPYPYVDGLILGLTRNIAVLDILHRPRAEGAGNYNLRRSISLWLRMATSFSVVPLRLATLAGGLMAGLGLLILLYLGLASLTGSDASTPWAAVMALILFVGGIQTCCVGLLGEYLGRNYLSINAKPQYLVGECTGEPRKTP